MGWPMSPEQAGPARVVRWDGYRWVTIGPVLPPIDDPEMHRNHVAGRRTWWHLPAGIAQAGDRLLAREHAWEFRDRCGPNNHMVHTLARYWEVPVAELLAVREVWSMRPVVLG